MLFSFLIKHFLKELHSWKKNLKEKQFLVAYGKIILGQVFKCKYKARSQTRWLISAIPELKRAKAEGFLGLRPVYVTE